MGAVSIADTLWVLLAASRLPIHLLAHSLPKPDFVHYYILLAVASIVRDDPSTLPGNDPFPRARMHRDHNAR